MESYLRGPSFILTRMAIYFYPFYQKGGRNRLIFWRQTFPPSPSHGGSMDDAIGDGPMMISARPRPQTEVPTRVCLKWLCFSFACALL